MLLGIRFPRAHDPYKLGRTFDKGDKQQAIAHRVTDQDFAVFIIGVFLVGDDVGKFIRESRSGFFKTNAVFSEIRCGFVGIPLKIENEVRHLFCSGGALVA